MMRYIALSLLCIFAAISAYGHGVDAVTADADSVVAVEIRYNSGEPMTYATISVFSPSSPKTEVIAGFADRNGRYAFIPDEDGEWRVEASDGMGHKSVITVNATMHAHEAVSKSGGKSPLYLRALLGVSLILNIFAVYSFVAKRRKHAHQ
jgi:nickel transport protein